MRNQTVIILLIVAGVIGLTIGIVLLTSSDSGSELADQTNIASSGSGSIALESNGRGDSISLAPDDPESSDPEKPLLNVLGDSRSQSQAQNPPEQNTLPGPDDFDQYEQFANNESTSYVDIVEGTGSIAAAGDTLAVVYIGYLSDGTVFDGSRTNEEGLVEPFVLKLGARQVIAGWEQGLTGMREGGRRRLIIPPALGYGTEQKENIPANSLLIFDVELAQVQKAIPDEPGL